MYKHLFGPVPSRRLGISLGVDLVPFKYCSFNCVYCELGATTHLTSTRKEYIPVAGLIKELTDYLKSKPLLDFITFSGSGEPTLHSGIREITAFLKTEFPQYALALLTNSSLLPQPEVRQDLKKIDLILPSLDAASEKIFRKINRPAPGISAADIITGLIQLRNEFQGQIWLEIFIIPGLNDTEQELHHLRLAVNKIKPDKIQINTLDRPGTEKWVTDPTEEKLKKIVRFFAPLPAEYITRKTFTDDITRLDSDFEGTIIDFLKRRPATSEDLAKALNLHPNELGKYLADLLERNIIRTERQKNNNFYLINKT